MSSARDIIASMPPGYVRMYRLAYVGRDFEMGTLIVLAPPNEVWSVIPSATGWDNCQKIVREKTGGLLLAITPIADDTP